MRNEDRGLKNLLKQVHVNTYSIQQIIFKGDGLCLMPC
jgi:hypothetical protein